MLPADLATEELVILHPQYVDDRGTLVPDWDQPPASMVTVLGCSVQPDTESEALGRQQTETLLKGWLPIGVEVSAFSRIVWRGSTYEVVGPPKRWHDPYGELDHQVVSLRKQEG